MDNIFTNLKDTYYDVIDYLKYDLLGQEFQAVDYKFPPVRLRFFLEKDGIYAISTDLPGFLVTARTMEDIPEAVFDTLLVYYDIPRYQAKKLLPNISIELDSGQVITTTSKEQYNYR